MLRYLLIFVDELRGNLASEDFPENRVPARRGGLRFLCLVRHLIEKWGAYSNQYKFG